MKKTIIALLAITAIQTIAQVVLSIELVENPPFNSFYRVTASNTQTNQQYFIQTSTNLVDWEYSVLFTGATNDLYFIYTPTEQMYFRTVEWP